MRSLDGYIERHKKSKQSSKQKQDPELEKEEYKRPDWDFIVNDTPRQSKNFPITLDAAQGESAKQKFERYARQLGRCILACSLCERGCKMFNVNNTCRIPHFQPTIQHKKYMLIKNRPENKDINGLFSDIIKIINDNGLKKDDFYITTVTKCYGDDDYECPYFALEWDAMKKVPPDVAICFDEKSAISIGAEFKPRKLISMNNYKVFCVENMSDLELFLKVVNQQNRNRQIS